MNLASPWHLRQPTRSARIAIFPLLAALILSACGGSGGGAANTSAPVTAVGGSVVDGPIKGATIKAFEIKSTNIPDTTPLATTTTAADGSYSLNLAATFSGTVVITATGGQYCAGSATVQVDTNNTCPTGTTLSTLNVPLLTVAQTSAGTTVSSAHLTPISTAATPLTASVDSITGVVSGTLAKADFDTNFGVVSGGKTPGDAPKAGLATLLERINKMQSSAGEQLALLDVIGNIKSGATAAAAANEVASTPYASFSIKAGGSIPLMPADLTTAKDPTILVSNANGTKTSNASATSSPYFQERANIDVATLKSIMNDKSVSDVNDESVSYYSEIYAPISVTVGNDTYKGYRLGDVVVRSAKFRPADYNTGAFGVTTAIVAFGAKPDGSTGRLAAFSFTELIRTENRDKTIVAFEKNGAALPASEGALAIIAGNDDDKLLRKVPRLKEIHVRNDYAATAFSVNNTDPALSSFQVTGQVIDPINITANTLSTSSSQGYYAVDKIGSKSASSFKTYHFQEYGPRHMNYWFGQGVRLSDVLDTAQLKYPADKGACFVVVTSANNQPALFSCGELYNSKVGRGDGLEGASNRSRYKGVLLVTDDFRNGTGDAASPVMMTCWNYFTCTVSNAGDPTVYKTAMNTTTGAPVSTQVNKQMIALISTQDYMPFQPQGRWFPYSKTGTGSNSCTGPTNCIPWVDVGERMQQNIKSMTVYFAAGTGNGMVAAGTSASSAGTSGSSTGGSSTSGSGAVCSHDQIMAGSCVKVDKSVCTHLDYMAGTVCYLP